MKFRATEIGDPLTPRQAEVHRWMLDYQAENQMPPSVREIQDAFGFKSPNGTMCHIRALAAKGFVRRNGDGSKRRSAVALDPAAPRCPCCGRANSPEIQGADS